MGHSAARVENPTPLMISHGWPGSVSEFFDLIEPLAHPENFGGDIEDAFTVIALPFLVLVFLEGRRDLMVRAKWQGLLIP